MFAPKLNAKAGPAGRRMGARSVVAAATTSTNAVKRPVADAGPVAGTAAVKKTTSSQTTPVATVSMRSMKTAELSKYEAVIRMALSNVKGRGKEGLSDEQRAALDEAVAKLESAGELLRQEPTNNLAINGNWRLLFTSRPGSASPIQRTFTGVESFSVFQEVDLEASEEEGGPRVTNVVDFGPTVGFLRVEAQASTDARPLAGFTPRRGAGIPLFGKSETYPPARPGMRVDFQFDQAAFTFKFLPIKIPYPVPFRYLGDETKGWLDVTYLSPDGTFRLSRGNKGTLFILSKEISLEERLEVAIAAGDEDQIMGLVALMQQDSPTPAPARSPLAAGRWRLIWSQQAPDASPLQRWGSKQAESFQVIDGVDGSLANIVNLSSWATIRADAVCAASSDTRTSVLIQAAYAQLGPIRLPLPVPKARPTTQAPMPDGATSTLSSSSSSSSSSSAGGKGAGDKPVVPTNPGFVEWLYLSADLRITRGSKGSLFIHRRS